jgi:hypothetical protein
VTDPNWQSELVATNAGNVPNATRRGDLYQGLVANEVAQVVVQFLELSRSNQSTA